MMSRYLSEYGYDPIVVTGEGATADRWAPEDRSTLAELSPRIDVRRLPPATHPETSPRWRGRAERWLGVRSPWARWWVAGSVGLGGAAGSDADLVYVWMQPYDSAEAGATLSRELDIPWIADLGDPWALDEMMVYPSALHRRRERRRMGDLLGTAAAVVLSTPEAAERVLACFPELADRPVLTIPNGYDAHDFETPVTRADDGIFRLVHTGSLHTELGLEHRRWLPVRRLLRGNVPGLDILTRSHVYLLHAIELLLERDPSLAGVLELHLAGVLTRADEEATRRSPVVKLHGYLTHSESIGLTAPRGPPLSADAEPSDRRTRDDRARKDLRIPRLRNSDPRRASGRRCTGADDRSWKCHRPAA